VCVGTGLLLLSFVAYQLWGTALYEHQAQDHLRQELQGKLHAPSTIPTTPPRPGASTTTTAPTNKAAPTTPDPGVGAPIGLMSIPKIGMSDAAIVEGTDEHQLQQGPGHYVGTPLPGQAGNAAIAGHRTTYGAPFYNLNELAPGDFVDIETSQGLFSYEVVESHVVDPSDTSVLAASFGPELTLTTCNPRYSAAQRLVVVATLHASLMSGTPSTTTSPTTTSPTEQPPTILAGESGLGGVSARSEVAQAVVWGVLTIATAALAVVAWRRGRRPWSAVAMATGIPLALGALLVCFQHVSLALPQSF
jgi:sortase A